MEGASLFFISRGGDTRTTVYATCGLDYSKCYGYVATQASDQAALEQIATKWRME